MQRGRMHSFLYIRAGIAISTTIKTWLIAKFEYDRIVSTFYFEIKKLNLISSMKLFL